MNSQGEYNMKTRVNIFREGEGGGENVGCKFGEIGGMERRQG